MRFITITLTHVLATHTALNKQNERWSALVHQTSWLLTLQMKFYLKGWEPGESREIEWFAKAIYSYESSSTGVWRLKIVTLWKRTFSSQQDSNPLCSSFNASRCFGNYFHQAWKLNVYLKIFHVVYLHQESLIILH